MNYMLFPAKPKKGNQYFEPTGNLFERTWRIWQFTGKAWIVVS